jgi:hypothetical protein
MKYLLLIILMCCFSVSANDRFRFSGYGSLVGGKVVGGELDPSGEKEFHRWDCGVTLTKILGTNLALSNDWIDLRASYFRTHDNTTADVFFQIR